MFAFLKLAFSVVPDYVIAVVLNIIIKYKNSANVVALRTSWQLESLSFLSVRVPNIISARASDLIPLKISFYTKITHCPCITGVFGL